MARVTSSTPATTTSRLAQRAYDREEILDAIRRWTARYGAPPTWLDWEPATARRKGKHEIAEVFESGAWPTTAMVCRQFSTLGAAVEAAGLTPRRAPRSKANLVDGEEVLRAIREWTRLYGDPPAQTDLDPYRARRTGQSWRADRYLEADWPSLATVRHHYGTLSAAVAAAGLQPRPMTETVECRVRRRRRNRLALVDHLAQGDAGADELRRGIRRVAAARNARDGDALEAALLAVAGIALGWADRVGRARRERRRPGGASSR